MCIIIATKKGVKFPSVENVKNACENNPDGFAMAWLQGDEIKTFRTMSDSVFVAFYENFIKSHSYKKTPIIIHARIATHGSKKLENTHCFVDDKIGMVFAHNGILSIENRGDMTDSETYFRDIFVPVFKSLGMKGAQRTIDACIGHSKFAMFNKKGELFWFGYKEIAKGVYYSNSSYEKVKSVFNGIYCGFGKYGNYGKGGVTYGGHSSKKTFSSSDKKEDRSTGVSSQKFFDNDMTRDEYDEIYGYWDGRLW